MPWATRTSARDFGDPSRKPSDPPLLATVAGRRLARDCAIVLGTFGVGYVIASALLSPVPLLSTEHALPRVLETPVAEAQQKLTQLGFRVKLEEERPHPSIPRGSVAWQDPPAGTILSQNAVVSLAPSAGRASVPVPDVIGLPLPQAIKVLAAVGLKPGEVDTVGSDSEPNVILATRPDAGSGREPGSKVDLVATGKRR